MKLLSIRAQITANLTFEVPYRLLVRLPQNCMCIYIYIYTDMYIYIYTHICLEPSVGILAN